MQLAAEEGLAAMEGVVVGQDQQQQQQQQQQQAGRVMVEGLNPAVQQQLNLESVKTRAVSLFKAISRILEEFDAIARTNALPKWFVLAMLFLPKCITNHFTLYSLLNSLITLKSVLPHASSLSINLANTTVNMLPMQEFSQLKGQLID